MATGNIQVLDQQSIKNTINTNASTISSHTSAISRLSVLAKSSGDLTVGKTSYGTVSINITRSGYTPIGIVGFYVNPADNGGTYNTFVHPYDWYISNNTVASVYYRNFANYEAKIKITVYVLYK